MGTTALLTLASVISLFQGVTAELKSKGLMTADVEIWNDRFAMLGLVALAFTIVFENLCTQNHRRKNKTWWSEEEDRKPDFIAFARNMVEKMDSPE